MEITTGNMESVNVLVITRGLVSSNYGNGGYCATGAMGRKNFNTGIGSLCTTLASAQTGDIVTFSCGDDGGAHLGIADQQEHYR
ncbi:hypothetical protein [Pseudomonas glycinae]|uniref:Ice nucleation protein n=1 Tax=Pseudomonas glycinae TaxID=1785145 RepID=A0ABM6QI31_9PSED|nr:hypothetical protein [Pseudomonas glycinae]AUG97623.1 hypothetical protein AWU82_29875 [Pseudomonas glycinae]